MKVWKKTVALLMALGMTFSVVACGEQPNNSSNSNSSSSSGSGNGGGEQGGEQGGGETNTPKTEDEVFAYVMDAMETTSAYRGSITLSMNSTENNKRVQQGSAEETSTCEESQSISYDATNKLRYMESTDNDSEYGEEEYYCKTFVQGGKLYGIEKGSYTPPAGSSDEAESGEDYFVIHDSARAEYEAFDYEEYMGEILETYSGIQLAANVAEVKTALTTATPILMQEMFEAVPTTTVTVTATETDGVCKFAFSINASAEVTMGTQKGELATVLASSLSAKDGKLTEFTFEMQMLQRMTQGETVLQEYSMETEVAATVAYSFAQAKYDALTVTLPTNPDDIYVEGAPAEDYEDVKINLYVNGAEADPCSFYDPSINTPQLAYAHIVASSGLQLDKVDAKVYKDVAFTQELNVATVTKAEILALESVYIKATPKTGYALVRTNVSEREEYSKAYQIAIPIVGTLFGGMNSVEAHSYFIAYEAGELQLSDSFVLNPEYEIWINGEKQTTKPSSITLEAGKTYEINYVRVVTDPVVEEEQEQE